jgi:hypothetical protein
VRGGMGVRLDVEGGGLQRSDDDFAGADGGEGLAGGEEDVVGVAGLSEPEGAVVAADGEAGVGGEGEEVFRVENHGVNHRKFCRCGTDSELYYVM